MFAFAPHANLAVLPPTAPDTSSQSLLWCRSMQPSTGNSDSRGNGVAPEFEFSSMLYFDRAAPSDEVVPCSRYACSSALEF
jgi:hypothetical protein